MNTTETAAETLKTCDLATITQPELATLIGLSRHNFKYFLEYEDTNYTRLLQAERKRRCDLLIEQNPHFDVHGLMRKTGYTVNTSALRAFKRWYGVGMSQWKRQALEATK